MNQPTEIPPLEGIISSYRRDASSFADASKEQGVLDAVIWDACARNGHFLSRSRVVAARGGSAEGLLQALACAVVFRLPHRAARPEGLDELFFRTLPELARLSGAKPARWREDPEGVEELVRLVLRDLGIGVPGETPEISQDRLQAVSLLERRRLLAVSREAEKRAREIREALAAKAAKEAADKYGRE